MQRSRIGHFALEEPLGGVRANNVFRGVHVERGASAAIKLLPRELIASPLGGNNFLKDAEALKQLEHPGIARVYGGAVDQGQPYLALELIDAESLRSRLDRLGRLPWETTVELAQQICAALHAAHRAGVVHRRLTPARILVTPDDKIKLIGFDSAWADRDEVVGLRVPMTTAHYLAPEAFRGKKSGELPTTDLFSVGVVLYECLTGRLPWPAVAPAELIRARYASAAPRASASVLECPVWLDVLTARLLERKRADRLPSADAARRAMVDAQRKVAAGMGATQHAWSGRQGALAIDHDRQELKNLRRKSARRERDDSPFYERAWFLAGCLALIVAGGVWSLWPASEEQLFAKAAPLIASDDPTQWRRAKDQYLDPLLKRFPQTQFAAQIDAFEDRYAIHRVREQVKNIDRFGRLPDSEAERRYAEAWRQERAGDRLSAWQDYEALAILLADATTRDERAFRTLALEGAERIRSDIDSLSSPAEFLAQQLARAEALISQGNRLKARDVLRSLMSIYADNRELASWMEEVEKRLARLDGTSDEAPSSAE